LREWIEWDDNTNKFSNELNFNEFLSWLYPKNLDEYEEGTNESDIQGNWLNRYIRSSIDTRNVSYLLRNSSKYFEIFRSDGDLEKAYNLALQEKYDEEFKKQTNPVNEVYKDIDKCIKSLDNIPYKMLKTPEQKEKLMLKITQLKALIDDLSDD